MIDSSFFGRSERNGVEIEAVVIVALALGKSLHEKALKLQEAERPQAHFLISFPHVLIAGVIIVSLAGKSKANLSQTLSYFSKFQANYLC